MCYCVNIIIPVCIFRGCFSSIGEDRNANIFRMHVWSNNNYFLYIDEVIKKMFTFLLTKNNLNLLAKKWILVRILQSSGTVLAVSDICRPQFIITSHHPGSSDHRCPTWVANLLYRSSATTSTAASRKEMTPRNRAQIIGDDLKRDNYLLCCMNMCCTTPGRCRPSTNPASHRLTPGAADLGLDDETGIGCIDRGVCCQNCTSLGSLIPIATTADGSPN